MPASAWKARRLARAADAQRPRPVIPQPKRTGSDSREERRAVAYVGLFFLALAAVTVAVTLSIS